MSAYNFYRSSPIDSTTASGTVTLASSLGPALLNLIGVQLTDSHGQARTIVAYDAATKQATLGRTALTKTQDIYEVVATPWMRGSVRWLAARTSLGILIRVGD